MKSLELNWIRKRVDKTIPMPEVVFHPLSNAGGKYYWPNKYELYDMNGKPHSMKYGVIVLDPRHHRYIKSTIAHEWRHHWQCFNGIKFESSPINLASHNLSYDELILKYFTTCKIELDALRFEYKYAGLYDGCEEILYDLIKDLRVKPIITYGNNTPNKQQKVQSRSSTIRHSHSSHEKTRRVQGSILTPV